MKDGRKYAVFAFRGEAPCVLHAVLNVNDMQKKGFTAILILEGGSVKIAPKMINGEFPLPWEEIKEMIDCACLGCSKMFKVDEIIQNAGIRLDGSMNNHISIAEYMNKGYEIIII
jgi:hypothetical protein